MTQENPTTSVMSATEAWTTTWVASYPTETGGNPPGASQADFTAATAGGFPRYMIAVIIVTILILIGALFFVYVTVLYLRKRKIRKVGQDETSGIVSQKPSEASD